MKHLLLVALLAALGTAAGFLFTSHPPAVPKGSASNSASMSESPKPDVSELKRRLSPEQFHVTQQCGTEPPFQNAYWNNKKPGIYVDVVSGEPLFSSLDKFDSGTGWPSFTRPVAGAELRQKEDREYGMVRTEVRSGKADSHLGHLFDDGPAPTGQRYCINSASLRFVPVEEMAVEGYASLLGPFIAAGYLTSPSPASKSETAILAGGCFWGMEEILRKIPGVLNTVVGYTGGSTPNPSYEQVCTGRTGHAEAIQIEFDPTRLSYSDLLSFFFRMHDPTTLNRQHNDIGTQYRSAIFVSSPEQRAAAERVREEFGKSGRFKKPIVTEITEASTFYPAEEYHQNYLLKNPDGYNCHVLRD